MRYRKVIRGIMGLVFLAAFGISIYLWETEYRERVQYTQVVTLVQDTDRNVMLEADDLAFIRVSTPIDDAVTDPSAVIGKKTATFVPGGIQLHPKFVEEPDLVLEEDEYVYSISTDYILTYPSSLRRGDNVFFYAVDRNILEGKSAKTTDEVTEEEVQDNLSYSEILMMYPELDSKDDMFSTTVLYVKDNANREVVTLSDEARYDGSSKISTIELKVTKSMMDLIISCIENDQIFVMFYQ